jgi:hypothetical protein
MGDDGLHEKNETVADPKYDGRMNESTSYADVTGIKAQPVM